MRLTAVVVGIWFAMTASHPTGVFANGPDPAGTRGPWTQEQRLEYGWLAGYVPPPATMQPAINRAAADSNSTNASRAADFAQGAGEGLVAYGASGTNWSCGSAGIACYSGGASFGWFHVNLRVHGTILTNPDGSRFTVRWCDIDSSSGSCWDVENVALDEMGHVLLLDHHSNPDYTDAVVQSQSRANGDNPNTGWNTRAWQKCDVAELQLQI